MTDPELIKPRTKSERRAYISGWMDAIVMIDNEGVDAARVWLREMAALELQIMQRNQETNAQDEQ